MPKTILLASLALLAAPAAADPILIGNADGSVTLVAPIDSAAPTLLLEPVPRRSRNAGHARARAEAEAEAERDRAFQEATAQAREAERVPRPH
jgi:hypothetical protein